MAFFGTLFVASRGLAASRQARFESSSPCGRASRESVAGGLGCSSTKPAFEGAKPKLRKLQRRFIDAVVVARVTRGWRRTINRSRNAESTHSGVCSRIF
ncbi:MAG: hypothetical protein COW42_05150 [Deltaproteobacteria bacterium CG17_big_fil_post_rev_8_21_14_2_50_63_7]|nr:MAG: hypothetical protein COW42_05150 [Deltaproteobacteria bacterium CG17_big_fil_post_rev_8_21_14_2_50_63_7]